MKRFVITIVAVGVTCVGCAVPRVDIGTAVHVKRQHTDKGEVHVEICPPYCGDKR